MFHVTAHEPWCTDHHHGAHPEDSYCRRPAAGDLADVYLSNDLDGQPLILAHRISRDEFTPEAARAYGLALLDLADAARPAVAA